MYFYLLKKKGSRRALLSNCHLSFNLFLFQFKVHWNFIGLHLLGLQLIRIMLQFSASKYAKVGDLDNIQDDTIVFKNMIDETNHT